MHYRIKKFKKKYPSIKNDLENTIQILSNNSKAGDAIEEFDGIVRKIRMSSKDMKKGKQGGFRIIYFLYEEQKTIDLVEIYAKNEREDISSAELKFLFKEYGEYEKRRGL